MFTVVQLYATPCRLSGTAASNRFARLVGVEKLLRPLFDGRKAGAGAARSPGEDGAATARPSPRTVIRGESPPGNRLVADGG